MSYFVKKLEKLINNMNLSYLTVTYVFLSAKVTYYVTYCLNIYYYNRDLLHCLMNQCRSVNMDCRTQLI